MGRPGETGESGGYLPIEETEVFARFTAVAHAVWKEVAGWEPFARRTVGEQLVRACDSVGANLVEGDGRGTDPDALRFFLTSRGSAREARYWLTVACERDIVPPELAACQIEDLTIALRQLNGLIAYRRRSHADRVKEPAPDYTALESIDPWLPTGDR